MGVMMTAIFVWMNFTFFLYHNSDANSYLAFLLGYAGTMNMIHGCGMKEKMNIGYAVMDLLMTIVIMTVMDYLFARETAAKMAQEAFFKAWASIKTSLVELMDPNFPDIAFRENAILGQIATASTLGGLADQEARWSRVPWRGKTFSAAVDAASRIRFILTGMKTAAAGGNSPKPKPQTLLALSTVAGWSEVKDRPVYRLNQVEKLLVILDHEDEGPCEKYLQAEEEISSSARTFEQKVLAMTQNANKNDALKQLADASGDVDSLEQDPASRQSYLLAACSALIEETQTVASAIVYEG
jgi:predicted membrane protein